MQPQPASSQPATQSPSPSPSQSAFARNTAAAKDLFSIPRPVKALFEKVPLLVYEANELPRRGPRRGSVPSLYIFARERDAEGGRPSFNPGCLKWQTFLNIAGLNHSLVASNNHASPTGVLPFLLPAYESGKEKLPVPAGKLLKYAREHGRAMEEVPSMRYEAYQSLLDHRIRNAWLYTLYLEPANFNAVAYPLYIAPASSNPLVRLTLSHQLRTAASTELLKTSTVIDIDDLYAEADKAFEALGVLLGDDQWFFGLEKPGLFDASVFAYTHLLLDEGMGWEVRKLGGALRRKENLFRHRERLRIAHFGGTKGENA